MNINIDLNDEQGHRLNELAGKLNVTAAELARAAIEDLLSRRDPDFEQAVQHVLKKNADLYRRLS